MDELGSHLEAARPAALMLRDFNHTGRYHIFQSHYYWFVGDTNGALRECEAAQALAATSGLDALAVRARFQRGLVHFTRGQYRETVEIMDEVSAWIESREPQDVFGLNKSLLVTTLCYSARAHADLGEFSEARKDAARSLVVARELDNQFAWVFAYIAEGWTNFRAGDYERALPFLERAHDICSNEEVPLMAPVAGSFLSWVLVDMSRDRGTFNPADGNRALTLAERAVKQGSDFRFGAFQPMRLATLSRALLAAGRSKEALERARAALDNARLQFEPGSEVEALLAASEALCSLKMGWQEPMRRAFSIAKELHMQPTLACCHELELRCKRQALETGS